MKDAMFGINPKIPLVVTVSANLKKAMDVPFQNWPTWIKNGVVDFVVAMVYTNDNQKFKDFTGVVANEAGNKGGIIINVKSSTPGLDTKRMLEQVTIARDVGRFSCISIFEYRGLMNECVDALRQELFRESSCTSYYKRRPVR